MVTLKDAAQQALSCLEKFVQNELTVGQRYTNEGEEMLRSIFALRTALAEQPAEQEPVAWMHTNAVGHTYFRKHAQGTAFKPVPLYTAPQPHREVELTANAILNLMPESIPAEHDGALFEFARAVIEAYKETKLMKTLYTAPQPRREVGLIANAILNLMPESIPTEHDGALFEFARAVIEAYKAKQGETK